MVFLLILFLVFAPNKDEALKQNNLVEIALVGTIINTDEVVEQIDKASEDEHIKGILLNIDSPGGAVAPSIEVAEAIKRARVNKPIIAYASGTIASGSYYASIYSNKIVANAGSLVGSIGVVMQGYNLEELMSKVGIKPQSLQAGKYKQVGSMDRAWRDFEVEELEKILLDTYDMFVSDVAEARGLDVAKKDEFADAHIFTARQAVEVGLVDEIGTKYDAKKALESLSGVDKAVWNKEDKLDKIMKKLASSVGAVLQSYLPPLTLR
ncbi:MAG: signal peptide peptidase SppA [Sulfurimonas sp.]|jgi:protease-4|nr:signal peptide peptidase SppA [Sulfurimonadaceae bacterium]